MLNRKFMGSVFALALVLGGSLLTGCTDIEITTSPIPGNSTVTLPETRVMDYRLPTTVDLSGTYTIERLSQPQGTAVIRLYFKKSGSTYSVIFDFDSHSSAKATFTALKQYPGSVAVTLKNCRFGTGVVTSDITPIYTCQVKDEDLR